MVWLLNHTHKFPKQERFRLARRIEEAFFNFHEDLIRATAEPRSARTLLLQADVELAKLRAYLRLSVEMNYTSPTQLTFTARQLDEIGKLLGGWIKSLRA